MTLAHWLDRTAHAHPDLPALARGRATTASYRQLASSAGSIARYLRRAGCRRGEPVAIFSESTPEFFEAAFGAWWGGYAIAPIEPGFSGESAARAIEHCGARVCFASKRLAPRLTTHMPSGRRRLIVFDGLEHRQARASEPAPISKASRSAPAWLHFGPAPQPGEALRAAVFTHRSLMNMALAVMAEVDTLEPRDAQIHGEPATLQSGMCALHVVARGGVNVTPDSGGFDSAEVFELASFWRRASLLVEPRQLEALTRSEADCDPTAFRSLLFGGAAATERAIEAALDRFGPRLSQVYGVRELPLALTRLGRHDIAARAEPGWRGKLGSIGRSFLLTELKIVGPDGMPTPAGRSGEIWARGPVRMVGYWRDAKATDNALRGQWLRTGLSGSMDAGGYVALRAGSGQVNRGAARAGAGAGAGGLSGQSLAAAPAVAARSG